MFPKNSWLTYEEYKQAIEGWLNSNYTKYLYEAGEIEWTNSFSGKHHSMVIVAN